MSGVIDLNGFQEILRKVQQERDHYRSETARLRTENASLLNDIDVLKARLSDREGERVVQEAVDAQRKACIDYIKNEVGVEDVARAWSAEGSIDSPPHDEPSPSARDSDHEVVDEIDINEFIRSGHLVQWDEESTALESTAGIDWATGSYSTTVPQPEWDEDPNVRPETISMYSEESPLYPFYRGKKGKDLLNLSAERIARCLENVYQMSCDSPCSPVEVSSHFLADVAFTTPLGTAKLQVPASPNRTTMRHLLLGSEYLYFPIKVGSPGLLLSCRKEVMKGSHNWSCFASMRDAKKTKQMMYVGDYRLMHLGELSLEEYNLQPLGAKKRLARQGLIPSNKWKEYKKGPKVEQQAALQVMMDAFATGKEKVRIIAMEFVGYDLDFAEHVRAKWASWVPTNT
ncbi:hypothetical protein PAXINDRAFT_171547 [Paxillus involutus ATCC 200175]|uniref:DUF6697 domain-containing protein n=1 Tax=Paxillus involutus ATCC 200175 TaxID=664439 RepID=A0A0C9TW32_PAXIN|nr:hypothetical protein PAXINDRAFT_171547 [Paxillus involutus ATCC 200175]